MRENSERGGQAGRRRELRDEMTGFGLVFGVVLEHAASLFKIQDPADWSQLLFA